MCLISGNSNLFIVFMKSKQHKFLLTNTIYMSSPNFPPPPTLAFAITLAHNNNHQKNTIKAAERSVFAICRTKNTKHKMIQLKQDLINRKYFPNRSLALSFRFCFESLFFSRVCNFWLVLLELVIGGENRKKYAAYFCF
jgi:hypothetical protein